MAIVRNGNQFPTLFDRFFNRNWIDWSNQDYSEMNTTLPSVNIKESADGFEFEVAAPGLAKEDFQVVLKNNVLTISSEKKMESETKDGEQFTRQEFSYQSFSRSFTLPDSTDSEKIRAKYENGILRVNIPKKEEAKVKPVKQIDIS
jgi:HSP20 family protein